MFFVWPLLLVLLDVTFVVTLLVAASAARIFFRRPWTVEAVAEDGARHHFRAVGWSAGRRLRNEVAARLASGDLAGGSPPQAV